jgi:phenylalanyl-tRNA synthetase beta chain
VANNLRQKQTVINIFEIAKTYVNTDEKIQEQYALGIALCGTKSRWFGIRNGHIQDEAEFLHLKGILEALFKHLGISEKEYKFIPEGNGQEFKVQVKGDNIGIVKRLSREILDRLDIKNKGVFAAEITLDKLLSFAQLKKQFKAFPRYPGISRDITLELREEVSLEQVQNLILHIGGGLLLTSEFVAYFKGKQVPNGFKRLTVSCRYSSPQRTLTEAEVNPVHENVMRELQGKFKAKIC